MGALENATVKVVREAVQSMLLDVVHLHGEEPIEFERWVGVPVIKAFGLGGGEGGKVRRPGYHILFWLILSSAKVR